MKRVFILLVIGLATSSMLLAVARGELSRQQQGQLAALKEAIDHAARLFKREKFTESAGEVAKCQNLLAAAAADAGPEMLAALKPAHARLQKAHTLFAAKRIPLPDLPDLRGASGAGTVVASSSQGASSPQGGEISFSKHVAPILVSRCGGCHVGRNMGEFSMATFASLMRGSENGVMIEAGKPDDSILVFLVDSGEMPPPRPRPRPVPKDEVQVLKDWVAQGAKFDGDDEEQPLLEMVPPEIARTVGRGGRGGRRGPGGGGFGPGRRRGPAGDSRPTR